MSAITRFAEDDVVGFRPMGLGKAEKMFFEAEGVEKHGWGPFRVKGIVEDRNGSQLHVSVNNGQDAILPTNWFIPWAIHPKNEEWLAAAGRGDQK